MKKLIIAAMHRGSGKTGIVVGLAKAAGGKIGYLKPFGNKLRYDKKRLWDYDAALMKNIFNLPEEPEELSIGFEHSRLKYTYNEQTIKEKLQADLAKISAGKDLVFIEGGSNLYYGTSIHLDTLSLAGYVQGKLIIVISGSEHEILDDIRFIKKYINTKTINFGGVIINKVTDVKDFKATHLPEIKALGITVLGVVPYEPELTYVSVEFLADYLLAKVLAGTGGLKRIVKNVFIGAMSGTTAMQNPVFKKDSKLIITSGDRSDMIVAALGSQTSAVLLTNNVMPSANLISKADDAGLPLLLVPWDTYDAARRVYDMDPLLTKNDTAKTELLTKLVRENVNLKETLA